MPSAASVAAPSAKTSASVQRATMGARSPLSGARSACPRAVTQTMARSVPTPGSTTATCTAPAGKYSKQRESQKPASATRCGGMACVTSMMRTAGNLAVRTPFMTPTNGSSSPKSVVSVTTPDGWNTAMSRLCSTSPLSGPAPPGAAGSRCTRDASVCIRHRFQPLRLDLLAADDAGGVAPFGEPLQRLVDAPELDIRRPAEGGQDPVPLALRGNVSIVRAREVRLMLESRIGAQLASPQLVAPREQTPPNRLGDHEPLLFFAAGGAEERRKMRAFTPQRGGRRRFRAPPTAPRRCARPRRTAGAAARFPGCHRSHAGCAPAG